MDFDKIIGVYMNEIFYKVNDVVYRISEGDGGNLLKEDIENGYVDFLKN